MPLPGPMAEMQETCALSEDTPSEAESEWRGVRKHEYLCFRGNGITGLTERTSSLLPPALHLPRRLSESPRHRPRSGSYPPSSAPASLPTHPQRSLSGNAVRRSSRASARPPSEEDAQTACPLEAFLNGGKRNGKAALALPLGLPIVGGSMRIRIPFGHVRRNLHRASLAPARETKAPSCSAPWQPGCLSPSTRPEALRPHLSMCLPFSGRTTTQNEYTRSRAARQGVWWTVDI